MIQLTVPLRYQAEFETGLLLCGLRFSCSRRTANGPHHADHGAHTQRNQRGAVVDYGRSTYASVEDNKRLKKFATIRHRRRRVAKWSIWHGERRKSGRALSSGSESGASEGSCISCAEGMIGWRCDLSSAPGSQRALTRVGVHCSSRQPWSQRIKSQRLQPAGSIPQMNQGSQAGWSAQRSRGRRALRATRFKGRKSRNPGSANPKPLHSGTAPHSEAARLGVVASSTSPCPSLFLSFHIFAMPAL